MKNYMKYAKAVDYAKIKHEGQIRRGIVNQPYIVHPLNVAQILERTGCKDEVVIAGVLHDVVEDTPTKLEEITAKFGKKISALVASVTEKGVGMTWDERLKTYLEKVSKSSYETKMICAADKIDNMNSMTNCLNSGYNIFEHMHAGKEKQINKFKLILDTIGKDLSPEMVAKYEESLKALIEACNKV